MANISKAERERRAAEDNSTEPKADPKPVAEAKADPSLVQMTKGNESLAVHPSCVKAHQSAGWSIKEA
jgi:hypothetical protein